MNAVNAAKAGTWLLEGGLGVFPLRARWRVWGDKGKTAMKRIITSAMITLLAVTLVLGLNMPRSADAEDPTPSGMQLINAVQRGDLPEINKILDEGTSDINVEIMGQTPLLAAIRRGEPDVVKLLLERGANPNHETRQGRTPQGEIIGRIWPTPPMVNIFGIGGVCRTARFGKPLTAEPLDDRTAAILKLLLKHGADPNGCGLTLMPAALHGQIDLLRLLVEKGADVNKKWPDGSTAILWAAVGGRDDVVQLLKDHGAVRTLGQAAMIGDRKQVERFLKTGADIRQRGECGWTPLIAAAWGGDCDAMQVLLTNLDELDGTGVDVGEAFRVAVWRGNIGAARLLLEHGPDVNAANEYGWTPLMEAAWEGDVRMASMLLEAGARVDDKDVFGKTALLRSVELGHAGVAKLLLEKGADVNAAEPDGWTAAKTAARRLDMKMMNVLRQFGAEVSLHSAAIIGDVAEVQRFLEASMNADAADEFGRTPLIWAGAMGRPEVARLLVEKGAKVDLSDDSGRTALAWAAMRGEPETLKLLLDNGADVNATAKNGWTPLMWASRHGHAGAVTLVLQRGADVNRVDATRETALTLARETPDIVAILESHGARKTKMSKEDRGNQCGDEWDYDGGLYIVTGAPAPRHPLQTIRMDGQEVILRLGETSFAMDALFQFYNTGEATNEWVGFPWRGNVCANGRLLDPAVLLFDTWIDGRKVKVDEESDLLPSSEFFHGVSPPWIRCGYPRHYTYDRWLMTKVTFPGHSRTTIRVSYEDTYGFGITSLQQEATSYWKDRIRHLIFTVDASGIGGTTSLFSTLGGEGLCRITQNLVRHEMQEFKPSPHMAIGAVVGGPDRWELGR